MRAPLRGGRIVVHRYRNQLSARELEILISISRYRYLSARQIETLHFFDHASPLTGARTCRRVLSRLTESGVLWRLERRVGGVRAGSASFVYALTPLGYRTLAKREGGSLRRREPSAQFLDHTLAIADLVVALSGLARQRSDIELLGVEPEPNCWRRFSVGLGEAQILKPDLAAFLRVGEFDYSWFIEVDLATHSSLAIVRKCRLYQAYWASGSEQDRYGLFPRVLFVTPSQRRANLLTRTISAASNLNHDLFAVTISATALATLTGASA